jgi:uncharacterized membrane protein
MNSIENLGGIAFLAFVGLALSLYILVKKRRNDNIVCLLGQECNSVVKSRYSTTFGFPNEVIGAFYYLALLVIITVRIPSLNDPTQLIIIASFTALIFSIYLSSVQLFVLKKICGLCLLANLSNALIFFLLVI